MLDVRSFVCLLILLVGAVTCLWDDELYEDDHDVKNTRMYVDLTRKMSPFDVGSRMRQYNMMKYYSNTLKYHPYKNARQMLAKSWVPVDTDGLDKFAKFDWLGQEYNPVKDNAVMYNLMTSPFIKDATYNFYKIPNGVGKQIDQPILWYGPNQKKTKAMIARRRFGPMRRRSW